MRPDVPLASAPVPAVHAANPRRRRVHRSAVSDAADTLGAVTQNCEIFRLTNGQFSIIDVLEHCIQQIGPATLDIATWTAADGDLRRAHAFLASRAVTRCRFVVDPSFRTRKPEFCAVLINLFGNDGIRTTPLHGKFAVLRNSRFNLAIRTSMNLNPNKRIENVEISDDPELADVFTNFVDEIWRRSPHENFSRREHQNAKHDHPSRLAF